ncbi:DUF4123 domain-containing protein [Scandinavium sp. NPDC088450]|uniref:DUF4123 domain-containing protein n=1 Tax=Scandinavium sp. NPDC088450 TaxID=3364514 RepID=UPI00384E173B
MITSFFRDDALTLTEHQYLVIDRMRVANKLVTLPLIELVTPLTRAQAHLYPWLLSLNSLSSTEWDWVENLFRQSIVSEQPSGLLLLKSEQPEAVVRHHLTNALFITDPQRQKHILRYYDPRVLFHLSWIMDAWNLSNLLNAHDISDWTFCIDRQWHTLSFSDNSHPEPVIQDRHQLFSDIQRIGLINVVLARITSHSVGFSRRQQLSRDIFQLLVAGETWLTHAADLCEFAYDGIQYGKNFYHSTFIKTLLEDSKNTPGIYCQIARSWDQKKWLLVMEETAKISIKGIHYESEQGL